MEQAVLSLRPYTLFSGPRLPPNLLEVLLALGGQVRGRCRRWVLGLVVEFNHHHTTYCAACHQIEDGGNVYLPLSKWAVVNKTRVLAVIVLQVHVLNERQVVGHDLDRVRAALFQLTDIRTELENGVVDGVERCIGLIPRFDAGSGVLMEHRRESLTGHDLRGFVQ